MNQSCLLIVFLLFLLAHQGNSQKITDNHSARIDPLFHYLDRIDSPGVAIGDRYVISRMENLRLPKLFSYFEGMNRNLTEPAIPDEVMTKSLRIRRDLEKIVNTENPRNFLHVETLNTVAHYIKEEFQKSSSIVREQEFEVEGATYKNIICSLGPNEGERIIVGAHYDVAGDQPGADDNASGVAGLLELSRLLKNEKLQYRVDLVAYALEEPPFFGTKQMGSYVHAKFLYDHRIPVKGMICLEMIGFYSEKKNSQHYPIFFLQWLYGRYGNFITVVQKLWSGEFAGQITEQLQKNARIKTRLFKGPRMIPGVDFSDHLNYWKFGYSAVMITDTAFYRNPNYHEPSDTIDTLDIPKIALFIEALAESLLRIE